MKIRPGDEIEIKVKVESEAACATAHYVKLSNGNAVWVPNEVLSAGRLRRRPIGVGDRVYRRGLGMFGDVKAIDDGRAWVSCRGEYFTVPLSDLTPDDEG